MKSNVSIFLWLILSVSSLRSPCLPQIRVDFYVWVSDPLGANFCSLALGGSGVCFPWGYRVVEHRWSKIFFSPLNCFSPCLKSSHHVWGVSIRTLSPDVKYTGTSNSFFFKTVCSRSFAFSKKF